MQGQGMWGSGTLSMAYAVSILDEGVGLVVRGAGLWGVRGRRWAFASHPVSLMKSFRGFPPV